MKLKLNLLSFVAVVVVSASTEFSTVFAESGPALAVFQTETQSVSVPGQTLKGLRDLTIRKGTSSTGGGGRTEIPTDIYPDEEKLKNAIRIIREKVSDANLPEQFKRVLVSEVNSLYAENKITVLPALIDFQRTMQSHRQPEDKLKFNSIAGISNKSPGSRVILSWLEHQKMNTTQAASNIMHEISHNILSEALTEDEQFVSDLENAIMNNQMTKELLFALNEGIYVKDGVIYIDQLIDFAGREDVLKKSMTSYFAVQEKYLNDWWIKNKNVVTEEFVAEVFTKNHEKYEALDVSQYTQIYGRKFLTFMKSKGWHPGLLHMEFFIGNVLFRAIKSRIVETNPTAALYFPPAESGLYMDCTVTKQNWLGQYQCVGTTPLKEFFNLHLDRN